MSCTLPASSACRGAASTSPSRAWVAAAAAVAALGAAAVATEEDILLPRQLQKRSPDKQAISVDDYRQEVPACRRLAPPTPKPASLPLPLHRRCRVAPHRIRPTWGAYYNIYCFVDSFYRLLLLFTDLAHLLPGSKSRCAKLSHGCEGLP